MINVRNLTKSFGQLNAVKDISFDVHAGDLFAFLGPNGAGKTTTIRMLTTLLAPTSGSILIDGLDPMKHQNEVRRKFGIEFQDPSLDAELTAYDHDSQSADLWSGRAALDADRYVALRIAARSRSVGCGGRRVSRRRRLLFLEDPTLMEGYETPRRPVQRRDSPIPRSHTATASAPGSGEPRARSPM